MIGLLTHLGMRWVSGFLWWRLRTMTVMTREIVHMIIITEKYMPATHDSSLCAQKLMTSQQYLPRSGTASDVDGTDSATINIKTDKAKRTVIPETVTSRVMLCLRWRG